MKDDPLKISIENETLVISIGIGTLAFAFEENEDNNPFNHELNDFRRTWIVSDQSQFAKDVISTLSEESETGRTPLTDLLDKMCLAAVEDGSIAVSETLSEKE